MNDSTLSRDETDLLRCAINRAIRAGSQSMGVDWQLWPAYRQRLEEIREKIRVGPPDELSAGY